MDLFGNPEKDDAQPQPETVRKLPAAKGELTRLQSEFLDKAVKLYGESALERGDLGFMHTLLANCYLPRGKTTERRYIHQNGAYSVLLDAGALMDPTSGKWVDQPLPYGGKPRALMAYVNTYAVRHGTRDVPLGHSLTDFVRRMSGEASGGEKGALNLWKKQMMALAASNMRIGGSYGAAARTRKVDIISEIDLWLSPEPNQLSLFPTEIRLSADYLETLKEHALPVDMAALRMLQSDPLAFDVYAWLAYRLPRIRQSGGVKLPWKLLFEQFGGGYTLKKESDLRFFKRRFMAALRKVKVLYPAAQLDIQTEALTLKSSPPLIQHTTTIRKVEQLRRAAK